MTSHSVYALVVVDPNVGRRSRGSGRAGCSGLEVVHEDGGVGAGGEELAVIAVEGDAEDVGLCAVGGQLHGFGEDFERQRKAIRRMLVA